MLDRVDGAVVQEVRAKVETDPGLQNVSTEQLAEIEAILASANPNS